MRKTLNDTKIKLGDDHGTVVMTLRIGGLEASPQPIARAGFGKHSLQLVKSYIATIMATVANKLDFRLNYHLVGNLRIR